MQVKADSFDALEGSRAEYAKVSIQPTTGV